VIFLYHLFFWAIFFCIWASLSVQLYDWLNKSKEKKNVVHQANQIIWLATEKH